MPGPRLVPRLLPLVLALLALALWVRRRQAAQAETPVLSEPEPVRIEPPAAPARRFERAAEPVPALVPPEPSEDEPIDIVAIVDDLLEIGR